MNFYSPSAKRTLFALLFLWALIIFMPGSYSVDSYNYYYQFSSNSYNDWHPPIIAYGWKILFALTGHYETIYVVQMALYWFLGYFLATYICKGRIGYWVTVVLFTLFLFIPQYVMKDTHMILTWGIACALLLYLEEVEKKNNRRNALFIICLLLVIGFLVRVNAVIAMIPVLYAVFDQTRLITASFLKKMSLIIVCIVALLGFNHIITYNLLKASRTYPEYKLMLLDITGISKKTGTNYLPAAVTSYKDYDETKLMQMYDPASFDEIYWPKDGTPSIVPMPDKNIAESTSIAWKKAIATHPFVYINNRLQGFLYYLRIKYRFAPTDYWDVAIVGVGSEPGNPMHLCMPEKSRSDMFAMGSFKGTLFFTPWFWLLLNAAFTVYFFIKHRTTGLGGYRTMWLIQLSGVLYMLSQMFVYQHDRDFRYHYWNVMVFVIGFIYMVGRPYLPRKEVL